MQTLRQGRAADGYGRRPWTLVCCALLLCLAVFSWGTRDKLSLYTPPHAAPVAAKAKLLSEQERPAAAQPLHAPEAPPADPQPMFAVLLSLLCGVAATSMLSAERLRRSPVPPCSRVLARPSLRRRPPPAR